MNTNVSPHSPVVESGNPHINQTIMQSIGFIVPPDGESMETFFHNEKRGVEFHIGRASVRKAEVLTAALNAANLARQSVPEFVMGGCAK